MSVEGHDARQRSTHFSLLDHHETCTLARIAMIPWAQLLATSSSFQQLCRSLRDYASRFHSSCGPSARCVRAPCLLSFRPHFAPECPLPRARLDHSQHGPAIRSCERPLHAEARSRSRTMFLLSAMCFAMFLDATSGTTAMAASSGQLPTFCSSRSASPPSGFSSSLTILPRRRAHIRLWLVVQSFAEH